MTYWRRLLTLLLPCGLDDDPDSPARKPTPKPEPDLEQEEEDRDRDDALAKITRIGNGGTLEIGSVADGNAKMRLILRQAVLTSMQVPIDCSNGNLSIA